MTYQDYLDHIEALNEEQLRDILEDIISECTCCQPSGVRASCQDNWDSYLDGKASMAEEVLDLVKESSGEN